MTADLHLYFLGFIFFCIYDYILISDNFALWQWWELLCNSVKIHKVNVELQDKVNKVSCYGKRVFSGQEFQVIVVYDCFMLFDIVRVNHETLAFLGQLQFDQGKT